MKKTIGKLILLAAISVVLVLTGITTAKYIHNQRNSDNVIVAEGFYFTVDLLGNTNDDADLRKEIHLYGSGDQNITLNVLNHFDALRITESDITYTFSVNSSYNAIKIQKGSEDYSSGAQCHMQQGVRATDTFTVTIPEGYGDQEKVTITIASSVPYKKVMKLEIVLHVLGYEMAYRVEDSVNSPYATLIVMSNVDVDPEKLIINLEEINKTSNVLQVDTTNAYVLDPGTLSLRINAPGTKGYIDTVKTTQKINAGASLAIYLFKTDITKNYSVPETPVSANLEGTYTINLIP